MIFVKIEISTDLIEFNCDFNNNNKNSLFRPVYFIRRCQIDRYQVI